MLTLLLMRHAKAVQHVPDGDFLRPLTQGGVATAKRLGDHLGDIGLLPDLAVVSASSRTRQTFEAVQAGAGKALMGHIDEGLYNASAAQIRDILRGVGNTVKTFMIVGHNPGIMELAIAFSRDGDPGEIERMRNRFPPCSLAVLTFDAEDWQEARVRGGRLDLFLIPEDLVSPS